MTYDDAIALFTKNFAEQVGQDAAEVEHFVEDLSSICGVTLSDVQKLQVYTTFLRHAINMMISKAFPITLHIIKERDKEFLSSLLMLTEDTNDDGDNRVH